MRASGFDAYLVRPVRRSSLLRIVDEVIAGTGVFRVDPGDARPARPARGRRARASFEVLLAEDNPINALLVRAVLERLGHTVTEVRDGAAAVAAATAGGASPRPPRPAHAGPRRARRGARIRAFEPKPAAARRRSWRSPPTCSPKRARRRPPPASTPFSRSRRRRNALRRVLADAAGLSGGDCHQTARKL